MGTVGAAAHLGGLVDLDVDNLEGVEVELLGGGVGLSVGEEVEEVLAGLLGPADLTRTVVLEGLALSLAADARDVAAEGDGLLVGDDVLEVGLGVDEGATLEGHGRLTGVLEVHLEVGTTGVNR